MKKMRYTHSENKRYLFGIGDVPNNWIESDKKDPMNIMNIYAKNELYVYDCDNCGSNKIFFYFENGECWELYHEYYWNEDGDLENDFYYDRVSIDKIPEWMKTDRDYLNTTIGYKTKRDLIKEYGLTISPD